MAKLYTTYIRESSEETAELDYLLTGTGSEKKQQKASLLEIQLKSALSPVAFVDTQEIVLPTDYMTTEQKFTYEKMTSEVMAAARGIETNYQDAFNPEYNWTPSNYYRELLGDDYNFIELAFDKEGSQLDKLINAIVNDPLGTVHTVLDAVGMIPGIGEVFDGVNGLLYLAEGNTLYAGLSAASMIPIFGMGATGGKYLAKYGDEAVSIVKGAGKTTREALLESASNQKLKNAIDQIYRPGATTGDGGLADAIRHQLSTGELVGGKDHLIKGAERVKNLENIIKKEALSSSDLNLAQKLLNDLKSALGGK